MSTIKEKAKEILARLPEDKLFSAVDYLEFLEKKSEVPIQDTGREVIIGPVKERLEAFRVFEQWRIHNPDKPVAASDARIDSILDENHQLLIRLVAPYSKGDDGHH